MTPPVLDVPERDRLSTRFTTLRQHVDPLVLRFG